MAIELKYTRADRLDNKCTHDEYFGQFVTNGLIYLVATSIGKKILASTDPWFNDIPLNGVAKSHRYGNDRDDVNTWDGLSRLMMESLSMIARANGGGVSISDKVCTLKAAARIYKNSPELIAKYPPL